MIKPGYSLYATKAGGRWFIFQARSPHQFKRMCVADEAQHGYVVPPRFRKDYLPDLVWVEARKLWCEPNGVPYGPHLPPGARESAAKGG